MDAITTTVGMLSDLDAKEIVSRLTKPGSEFQREVSGREGSATPIALVRDGSWRIVSWAATHQWSGLQTLEGFTLPECRRRGCQRAAACLLTASGSLNVLLPVAVFSPFLIDIARAVGCREVLLYELRDGVWQLNS
jgi:hypothetical protein